MKNIHVKLTQTFFFSLLFMTAGCAHTHKTTTEKIAYPTEVSGENQTETIQTTTTPAGDQQTETIQNTTTPADQNETSKNETTTTTTEIKPEHPGVLAATVHAIGYIIALPFTIIAGFLHIIF